MAVFEIRDFERNRDCCNDRNQVSDRSHDCCGDHVCDNVQNTNNCGDVGAGLDPGRLREECIIAAKVYDSCREQDCLRCDDLGPARAAEESCLDGVQYNECDIINPPRCADSVEIDRLRIKKVIITDKRPCEFRRGFWDITIKYVFEYTLIFRDANGCVIGCIKAFSIAVKKVSLFGSMGNDLVLATDLLKYNCDNVMFDGEPFVWVEAKAVALEAEICYRRCPCDSDPGHGYINVTIGLFAIVKIYRIVNLTVQSRGFCIPPECEEISPIEPCDFFDNLDFPMDIFAPPQKPEFEAGISGNIPNSRKNDKSCGCNA